MALDPADRAYFLSDMLRRIELLRSEYRATWEGSQQAAACGYYRDAAFGFGRCSALADQLAGYMVELADARDAGRIR